ncbi:MAG: LysE family translocator [Akkermansiaceae bacterium]
MSLEQLLGFAVVMALGQFSPGPDMILLTRTAVAEGLRAGWVMVAGIVTGLAVHASLAIGGMSVLLSSGGLVSQAVRIIAAAYLCWLAWGLIKKAELTDEAVPQSKRSPYFRGLFCNLLNLKALVFFAGVVAPFLDKESWNVVSITLWSIIVIEGLVLWGLWVWLLQFAKIKRAYCKAGRTLDFLFAHTLVILALKLVWWGGVPIGI